MADDISLVVGVDYTQLTGLIKTTKQTESALKLMAREFAKTGSQKDYMRGINQLVSAQKNLDKSSRMSRSEIMKLGNQMRQEAKYADALASATNKLSTQRAKATKIQNSFAASQMAATKASNRLGVVTQQAGYQVSDFVVQVQSGTNPLVAFSQQASQLSGVLPLVADSLGMTTRSAIALSAGLGIAIPLISSAAMVILNMRDSAAKTKKQMDAMEKGFNDISSSLNRFDAAIRSLSQNGLETLRERYGSITEEVLKLQAALVKVEETATKKSIEKQIETSFTPEFYGQLTKGFTPTQQAVLESLGDPKAMSEEIAFLENEISTLKASIESRKAGNIFVDQGEIDLLSDYSDELAALKLDFENAGKLKEELKLDQRIFEGYAKLEKQVKEALNTGEYEEAANKISLIRELAEEAGIDVSQGAFANLSQLESMLREFNNKVQQTEKLKIEVVDPEPVGRVIKDLTTLNGLQQKAQDEMIALFERSQELTEEIGQAGKEALILSGIDIAKPIDDATKSAAKLVTELGISLGLAEKLVAISAMGPERAKFNAKVRAGVLPPQAAGDFDVKGGETPFALQKYLDYVNNKNKDKTKKTKRDPLADLQKQLDLEQALVGKTQARQRIIQSLGVDFMKYGQDTIASLETQINKTIQLEEAERKRQEAIEEAKRQQEELKDSIESSMSDAFMSIIDGTKSVEDAFRDMARQIIAELMRVLVVKQMVSAATGFFGFADGGVFQGGSQVQAYANGGVVGGPTYFPMAGGKTGLMGEAGPEAIMPLKRGKDGKLGVTVDGGQQQSVVINQSFNFAANGDDSVKRIIASEAPKIAKMTEAQILDNRRRGGQFRKAFA